MSPGGVPTIAAIDLGASSGRVMAGRVADRKVVLHEVHRFANTPVLVGGTLHWDVLSLYRGALDGLRSAGRLSGHLAGVGIDSWAVDYGLMDADSQLIGNPVHYRDRRTEGVMERVLERVPASEMYALTGVQFLPFNTAYQLIAQEGSAQLAAARQLLLIPDLLSLWLTGVAGAEVTNASTTQLLDVTTRDWSEGLLRRLDIDSSLLPPLREPGTAAGKLLPYVLEDTLLTGAVPVTAVASHDTASAVVAVPAVSERFAYVSCGTWSLVGVELTAPVLTDASRAANFTNELGVDGTVRYLRNVMGLWLLQQCLRTWDAAGEQCDLETLLRDAARVPAFASLVDPDEAAFLPPGDMPTRIADACLRTGQTPPQSRAQTVRCILDSLALAYRRTIHQAQELSGRDVDVVHVVGGGARNALLCQLTADACGFTVLAGPVEAAALGNVLVQARALRALSGDLGELRSVVASSQEVVEYVPQGPQSAWARAEARVYAR